MMFLMPMPPTKSKLPPFITRLPAARDRVQVGETLRSILDLMDIPFFLAEEHCVVNEVPEWEIGQLLHLIPSHACTTCNLYREIVVHENGRVVEVWPIEASGKLS